MKEKDLKRKKERKKERKSKKESEIQFVRKRFENKERKKERKSKKEAEIQFERKRFEINNNLFFIFNKSLILEKILNSTNTVI